METKTVNYQDYSSENPLIISGPCSAETEEQLRETCIELVKTGKVHVLRAGIWKPRTRPGSFEGVGSEGLQWLRKIKNETGMPVAVEVANVKHIYEALKYGVDMLWIGSRTTTNPFSVQEIADSLCGVDCAVFVKNPMTPDVDLWIGAIERIKKAGIKQCGAIHRGFAIHEDTVYRNNPVWEIPITFRTRMPEIPLICDPSHICGNTEMLKDVSQKAIDLEFSGLMIESHINPDTALSDSKQQITPEQLRLMLQSLIYKKQHLQSQQVEKINTLKLFREQIFQLDQELISLLGKRMQIVDGIGNYKRENKMTVLQSDRWKEIIVRYLNFGKKNNLNPDFLTSVFDEIHNESINRQSAISQQRNVK